MLLHFFLRSANRSNRPVLRLVLFFSATLLGAAVLLAFVLNEVRHEAERQAATDAFNIVGVLEARLNAGLRRTHADLEHLAEALPTEAFRPAMGDRYRVPVSRELALFAARFPEIIGYRVVNAGGVVLYSSIDDIQSANLADLAILSTWPIILAKGWLSPRYSKEV